jgi:hypothetical protein
LPLKPTLKIPKEETKMTTETAKTLSLETIEAEFRAALDGASMTATRHNDADEEGDRSLGGWVNLEDITLPSGVLIRTGWYIHVEERNTRGQFVDMEAEPYPGSPNADGCEYSLTEADQYEWTDGEQDEFEGEIRDLVQRVLDENCAMATVCYLDDVLIPLVERRVEKAHTEQLENLGSATSWDALKDAAKAAGVEV